MMWNSRHCILRDLWTKPLPVLSLKWLEAEFFTDWHDYKWLAVMQNSCRLWQCKQMQWHHTMNTSHIYRLYKQTTWFHTGSVLNILPGPQATHMARNIISSSNRWLGGDTLHFLVKLFANSRQRSVVIRCGIVCTWYLGTSDDLRKCLLHHAKGVDPK